MDSKTQNRRHEAAADPLAVALPELRLVPRQCQLQPYIPLEAPAFAIADQFIAYASPDSTYAVTKRLLQGAKRSILIGIYDFTAAYVRDLLLDAVRRGVRVTVMLDLDNRKGEPEVWEALVQGGCVGVPAPSCASAAARYYPSCHQKVIVIDDAWTLVQSGNYSESSIPQNETDGGDPGAFAPGNRDMGLAVHSTALAAFFTRMLRQDMALQLDAAAAGPALPALPELPELPAEAGFGLTAAAPPQIPPRRFPSRRFRPRQPVAVQPVLSPENYMTVIPDLLAGAARSIAIEQQYIRAGQPAVRSLLEAIRRARSRHPGLRVRVILARPYGSPAEAAVSLSGLAEFGLLADIHVRYLNPACFVHGHNKLIIVDDQRVLVSSQNWSDFAVTRNREAGLLVDHAALARYYRRIFDLDWETGVGEGSDAPGEILRLRPAAAPGRGRVQLSLGDYLEV